MQSLQYLYRYGMGPSSSHTIGPNNAARLFKAKSKDAVSYRVSLYGSLSLTGKGHLTDKAIITALAPIPCEIVWIDKELSFHPNGMKLEALDGAGQVIDEWTTFSIGGGELRDEGAGASEQPHIYSQKSMADVLEWASFSGRPIWQLVEETEEKGFVEGYLADIWMKMQESIDAGLKREGVLQGGLKLSRKARDFMVQARRLKDTEGRTGLLSGYALAVAEENADGGFVVTAPTCGSCGILPSVLYYYFFEKGHSMRSILNAMATAGIIGNLVKENASISGAEVGCQGEVGTACAMAAGAVAQLMGGSPRQIEYAAEMALEHHLGLTCDPILGLVQVPCIERNAFAAVKAVACAEYSLLSDGSHLVSFDKVVKTMQKTGHDMLSLYRETSLGGLATSYFETHK
ncbi:L-serine ammonia-lyase [Desulfotalea psychrophila]|uniref:L-serine dehydratase n=1 Tax=Desulfotalea psychrophila (strain LSv54 / DSM 12343) TaxID=177439 RepID=Q6AL60_DESPS|nr:L-serine ammonia-lyase [Desulfotalea psychrophila]CAG36915.1 probable L-serine dehydratase [Desulfotalea psychrophila LSv54]